MKDPIVKQREPLYRQLRWFTRLRWLAAMCVVAGSVVDRKLAWYGVPDRFLAVGLIIGCYNLALWLILPRIASSDRRGRRLTAFAEAQLLLDMICLTALSVWTGGVRSPLIGFFVFHMVFASLLLREVT